VADLNEPTSRTWLTPARALYGTWLSLYGAWMWVAPWLAERRGDPTEAGWLPLFMMPSLIFGGLFGLLLVLKPGWQKVVIFAIATLVHAAVGLGFHPCS
jgi:hypothetical protein